MRYIALEIGKSAYTEFKTRLGDFKTTDDAILIDEIEADSEEEAYKKIVNSNEYRLFDNIIVKRVL